METKKLFEKDINVAVEILSRGGLVAIPTETVYGLAANALNPLAIRKIFKAKGRPMDNPLIVHISNFEEIDKLVSFVPDSAKKLADAFWPGPITLILPKSDIVPREVSANLPSVAIRMPSHAITRKLIKLCGFPLAAPSANLSGKPSPTCADHVLKDLDDKIDAILNGGQCSVGLESTVITFCTDVPRILRPGVITKSDIEAVIGNVDVDKSVLNDTAEDSEVSSPGMKYRHYSPNSNVILIIGSSEKYASYVNEHANNKTAALCFENDKELLEVPYISYGFEFDYKRQAELLFDALRKFDILGAKTVFVHCTEPKGIGVAVYNRLIRAAGFEIINV